MHVKDLDDCEVLCYKDDNCVSLNIKDKDLDSGTHECELNNFTHLEYDGDFKSNPVYYYCGAKVRNIKIRELKQRQRRHRGLSVVKYKYFFTNESCDCPDLFGSPMALKTCLS